jgi:hypothetical protein
VGWRKLVLISVDTVDYLFMSTKKEEEGVNVCFLYREYICFDREG